MKDNRMKTHPIRVRNAGFSLIELMVAMLLGLLVVGAAIGIFLSNKQAYNATQGLGRVQESAQIAFELMSRDIRETGGNPCDASLVASNIIDGGPTATATGSNWYFAVAQPLQGYEGSGLSGQVAGTDAIQLLRPGDDIRSTTAATTAASASATYTPGAPAFASGDPVMICDMKVLGVFKAKGASSVSGGSGTVSYGAGAGGNACGYFAQPNAGTCAGTATAYQFPKFTTLSALQGVRWFVRDPDNNAGNGYSLYRQVNGGNPEEVVQGVTNLQLQYLAAGGYVDANAITSAAEWNAVRAVRVVLSLRDTDAPAGSSLPIERSVDNVVTLRNRVL